MRLLFDHNLAPALVSRISDLYPGSAHVWSLGLAEASDQEIWRFARAQSFCIVSKDSDFRDLSAVEGFPPRVVWLRVGNCPTGIIADILRRDSDLILSLEDDETTGILILYSVG